MNEPKSKPTDAEVQAARDAIVEAALLCDFSEIFAKHFRCGDPLMGLGELCQSKARLLDLRPSTDRFRRRAIAQLERGDVQGALETLQRAVKP